MDGGSWCCTWGNEQAIPKKKKCKKAKRLSDKALQIAEKGRKGKSKGEKERYKHLNAEFQRIARRDKKAFLGDQCKEIEKNNRMGKTRELFKEIIDTKGTFHASSVQFSSVAQSCPTLCNPMTHVHWVHDAIQPSHPLSSPSPPAPNPSQHQGLFQWVKSSHEVAKVLEFQLQHQSFQWTPRTDLL